MNPGPADVFRPLYREGRVLRLLDQRLLPAEEIWLSLAEPGEIARSIRDMAVRGAPAIGVAAAYGAAFFRRGPGSGGDRDRFDAARALLAASRPTAVNLFAALERMAERFDSATASDSASGLEDALVREADAIAAEDIASCLRIGEHGAALLDSGTTVLTHCNAGALARHG